MAVNVATIQAKLEADTRGFSRDMQKAERSIEKYEKETKTASRSTDKLTKAMRGLAALGAAAMAKELFTLGVEVEAWGRRYETVFGDATDIMDEWVDNMNERFGVAEERLKGTAAAVGDLLVPMGFTRSAAAGMTQEILTLGSALSEWTGGQVDAEQATNILTKAMLGEREQLVSLGIKISEEDVKARLLAKNEAELTGELLKQARAVATLELLYEQTTDAQAAFAGGQTDAQAAATNAAAAFDQLKVDMADLVIGMAPLLTALVNVLQALNALGGPAVTAAIVAGFAAMALGAGPLIAALVTVTTLVAALSGAGNVGPLFGSGGVVSSGIKQQNISSLGLQSGAGRGSLLSGHSGGIVPGPRGADVPMMLQAGEEITPLGGKSGVTVIVEGSVISEGDLVEAVRRGLRSDTIRGGSLEFA